MSTRYRVYVGNREYEVGEGMYSIVTEAVRTKAPFVTFTVKGDTEDTKVTAPGQLTFTAMTYRPERNQ